MCWKSLYVLLLMGIQQITAASYDSPCPEVFRYAGFLEPYGIITVPNPYPDLSINITVQIYSTSPITEQQVKLEIVDEKALEKVAAGDKSPIKYRLTFPSSPLPTIKAIIFNRNVICRGSKPNSNYLATLTVSEIRALEWSAQPPRPPPPSPLQEIGTHTQQDTTSSSQCSDVFQYKQDAFGESYGLIGVPNPYPIVAIHLKVELYATGRATKKGGLQLVNNLNDEWSRMRTGEKYSVPYRLDFPTSSPLPSIKLITANNQVLCSGNKPSSSTSTYSFEHSIFAEKCKSSSLDCPDNIIGNRQPLTPDNPVYVSVTTKKPPVIAPAPVPVPPVIPQTPKPESPKPQPPASRQCGVRFYQGYPLIFGGQVSKRGLWPWHVAIYKWVNNDMTYQCGGSFVATRTIITAAHCVTVGNVTLSPDKFVVYLGRHNLRLRNEEGAQQIDVRRIIKHPFYSRSGLRNDIAILILASTVQYSEFVRPVCLWEDQDANLDKLVNKEGVVVGWGLDDKGDQANEMQMVKMPVVRRDDCILSDADYYSQFTTKMTFCAGYRNGSIACKGDSGSGIVFPEGQSDGTQIWRLRGIVSSGRQDPQGITECDIHEYNIFTDVASYFDWINQIII